jgi:hypothetical protein
MTGFPAKFRGLCLPCGEDIHVGDFIRSHNEAGYVHEECFDEVGTDLPFRSESRKEDEPIINAALPRGKSAKDRCDKCFMIHASGQEECE